MNAPRALFAWSLCILSSGTLWADDKIQFNRDIRPILSDNCFHCHGPDSKTRQADLRLDTEAGLTSQSLIVAGKPDESELFKRLLSTDLEQKMPPPQSHKSLSEVQITKIKQWIEQGAQYQSHWSFLALQKPDFGNVLPASDIDAVDFLIDRELSKQSLAATPRADRTTLLRRLHFDLTGLPPSPKEVTEFLNDTSGDAYQKQVERLLSSPHFGERMAMWWLDLVRYADTVGYHGDQDMSVWPFRDYVIESFNTNKPFDRFTREQLAGDLVPNADRTLKIASGYNRLGMMSAEGGVQEKEYLAKYIAERVRNVSGTWLGLTMGCCECHDHKFDALTSKEFYQMEAFFADIKERGLYSGSESSGKWGPSMQVPNAEQERQLVELTKQLADAETNFVQSTPELVTAQTQWESRLQNWTLLKPKSAASKNGATLSIEADGSIKASGESPATDSYTLTFNELPEGTTAFRLEVMPDDSLPKKGPGRAGNGNFVLSEFVAQVSPTGQASAKADSSANAESPIKTEPPAKTESPNESLPPTDPIQTLKFSSASASYEQTGSTGGHPYGKWAVAAAIDLDAKGAKWGWAIMEQVGRRNIAVFQLSEGQGINLQANQKLEIILHQNLDNPQHTLGRFRLWVTKEKIANASELVVPNEIADLLEIASDKRTADQNEKISAHFRSVTPILKSQREKIAELKKAKTDLDAKIPVTLVTETVPPRSVRVLPRGNWMDESGDVVEPNFPAAIKLVSYERSKDRRLNRQDLAEWIVARDNPLTARVFVNRLWKLYFGAGLARKLDDLGAQGEAPSHPELLDYLAMKFIESEWDVKQLIRTIVMTQAYQRSSTASAESLARDPQNKWLARQGRFRLDAELVRDNALSISGLLVKQVGGKSVKPYQPPGYWAYLNFPTREWANGTGDELYRRGLYTHWQRQYLHPSLLAFDAPSREECTADRPRSNTPLQSLALLNDPTYVESARALATRLLSEGGGSDAERMQLAFQLALSRSAREPEIKLLSELLDRARNEYANNQENAKQLLTVGTLVADQKAKADELAAWTAVARVVLNLHEVMTRN